MPSTSASRTVRMQDFSISRRESSRVPSPRRGVLPSFSAVQEYLQAATVAFSLYSALDRSVRCRGATVCHGVPYRPQFFFEAHIFGYKKIYLSISIYQYFKEKEAGQSLQVSFFKPAQQACTGTISTYTCSINSIVLLYCHQSISEM